MLTGEWATEIETKDLIRIRFFRLYNSRIYYQKCLSQIVIFEGPRTIIKPRDEWFAIINGKEWLHFWCVIFITCWDCMMPLNSVLQCGFDSQIRVYLRKCFSSSIWMRRKSKKRRRKKKQRTSDEEGFPTEDEMKQH